MLVVKRVDRVFNDGRIAESQFVILVDQGLLCLFITFVGKLLGLEEIGQFACLVNLSESTFAKQ